jgi:hypothetical protein
VFKSLTSVQLVPFQVSVCCFGAVVPANAIAEVLSAPVPPKLSLAVFKSATSVHEVPFQLSVIAVEGCPPNASADVCVFLQYLSHSLQSK